MPWPSKRKRQLENAREVKRQKQQPGEEHDNDESAPEYDFSDADGQDRCPEGDVLDEGDPQLEGEGIVYDEEVSRADSDAEDKDVNKLIEEYAEDWVGGLDRDDLRSLSILLHYLLVCLLQMGITGASKLIADVSGKCERTVREWRATFVANRGTFPDTLQGRYQRSGVLWQNEELNGLASRYVRENRVVKGKPNLNLQSFTVWVNTVLLPNHALDPGFPRKVSCETARKWLHELGFSVIDAKKGTYVDGHERADVVEYRAQFLRKMVALGFLNRENAPTPEAKLALPEDLDPPQPEVIAKTIVLFHDESTFQANDYERTQW